MTTPAAAMTGAELKAAMSALRVSRQELAQALGVTGPAISQWYSREQLPDGRTDGVRQALDELTCAAPQGIRAVLPVVPTHALLEEAARRSLAERAGRLALADIPTAVLIAELGRRAGDQPPHS